MDTQVAKLVGKRIVCLGGGIGTVNLIKGLREYTDYISAIVSVADDGGSAGRIRRLYNIPPPGDVVSCIAALSKSKNALFPKMLTYRFPGDRYGKDHALPGQKLGNLMMAAAIDLTGSFQDAIELMKEMFHVTHNVYASTSDSVTLIAKTVDGIEVEREENIDLGKYKGKRILESVRLVPENPTPSDGVVDAIAGADMLIAGPGDLYTTILPVLIIPAVTEAIIQSNARKVFVVNVANKPFETKGYKVHDFVSAITKHMGTFPFDTVLYNTNASIKIPKRYPYTFVPFDPEPKQNGVRYVGADLVSHTFPLYHDSEKLAKHLSNTL